MKIIAKANEDYLVQISKRELVNLVGYYWDGEKGVPNLDIGASIKISEIYEQIYQLKILSSKMKEMASDIGNRIEYFNLINPIVAAKENECQK